MSKAPRSIPIELPTAALATFCARWKIAELALFGSATDVTRFNAQSDLDLLATFADDANWSLLDHAQMELELIELFGGNREVDLVNRAVIEASQNNIRQRCILESTQVLYSAA